MLIKTEKNLRGFEAWSGAIETKKIILDAGLEKKFEGLIEKWYPEGITDTKLNLMLWYDADKIFKALGIKKMEEE